MYPLYRHIDQIRIMVTYQLGEMDNDPQSITSIYPLRTQEWTLWPIAINLLLSRGTAILAGMPTTQH